MRQNPSIAVSLRPERLMVRETTVLLGIAVLLPFLIHLIPSPTAPWGARLLPMFFAPLLGVALYRLHVGLIPAVFAPLANVLLTGAPAPPLVTILTIELVVFTVVVFLLLKRFSRLWIAGPLSYLAAKSVSMSLVAVLPWFVAFRPAAEFALSSIRTALPGLLLLTAVTALALHFRSRDRRSES